MPLSPIAQSRISVYVPIASGISVYALSKFPCAWRNAKFPQRYAAIA